MAPRGAANGSDGASPFRFDNEPSVLAPLRTAAEWLGIGAGVGALCGLASALFLFLLDRATQWRGVHAWMIYLLPVAGLVIGTIYARIGGRALAGTNLVIDTIHDGGPEIPLRMTPLVLGGTVLTHLFGGSAGREGTAVQMGASLADFAGHRVKLAPRLRRHLLAAGVAGGFASVFGTPIAGAVFGLELVVTGRIEYAALVPALTAAITGDQVTRLFITHSSYPSVGALALTPAVLGAWLVVAIAVAATAALFIELTHGIKAIAARTVPHLGLRMALGGAIVVGLWQLVGTTAYLGLGVPGILSAFVLGPPVLAFAWKLLFTAVTLGTGFLGGEVTPLFFIGATLGGVLGPALGLPRWLAAGAGMAAMFGAASNTPLALTIMAVELLGAHALPHVAIVTVAAFVLCGKRSIYATQRTATK